MLLKISTWFLIFLHVYMVSASDSDSDPLQDYCLPRTEFSSMFLSCKNPSLVKVEDFIFPGLNTLGMSLVRANFAPGGINDPHYHPRATEIAFVLEESIYSGFIDSQNRIFSKVLEKGDVMVFPNGLLHFQMNVGESKATILGSFNSQNPGLVRIPSAVFGSDIKEELLMKAFGLSDKELSKLRKKFPHVA